tara:strand:+ start:1964 stop:2341 length:378 start_codon:yes stop_codon:yes gene_type:complete
MIIYKLVDNTNGNFYIGSTVNLNNRIKTHYYSFGRYASCKIIENGDYTYKVIEEDNNDDNTHKLKREQYWINKYPKCINVINSYSGLTKKEYNKIHSLKRGRWIRSWGDPRYACSLWNIDHRLFN